MIENQQKMTEELLAAGEALIARVEKIRTQTWLSQSEMEIAGAQAIMGALSDYAAARVAEARAQEREACAKECDAEAAMVKDARMQAWKSSADQCARRIRKTQLAGANYRR